ncbi:MAG: PD-(D/E)XK nuclease family protein [Paludibacteraceae bacterium]|nr:PD-(D/E)XK nuclease family protein [Paludibacteraceae bacterium]
MKSFLQIVTDNLITRMGGIHRLEQCTLVFPMQRAGLFVKQYISQLIAQTQDDVPVVLPHMMTIDSLVDQLCPLQSDDEISSVFQLYEIYQRHTSHTLPLDAFYGWGVQLLNDFSSVDMALLSGEDIMHYTSTIKRYEDLELDKETRTRLENLLRQSGPQHSVQEYFTSLWKALPNIYRDFCELQTKQGVGSRGARTAWVIRHWDDEQVQQRIANRTYVFVGFNYLLAAEWKLMDLLREQALYYWDYDPQFSLDNNVYRFIRSNMQHFPNALDTQEYTSSSSPSIAAMACQSSSAQTQYVYEWLLDHHRKGETAAIVVADESMLPSVVYALPDKNVLKSRINITKGYPLRNTYLFAQVFKIIDLCIEENVMTEQLIPQTMSALESDYQSTRRTTHDVADTDSENTWQDILQDESYYQIQAILRRLQSLLFPSQFSTLNSHLLRSLIRRLLEQVNIPFHGEPVTDIQIIGVLETRLLDFDHVLILNVEEGVVPAITAERSFLPYDLRREYKMATREEDAQIYAYNFFRLFRRAKDVTLMFSDSFTDKGKRTMSRFLMQILCQQSDVQLFRLSESAKVKPFVLPATIFKPSDKVPSSFSPSAISEYITCPRWFYLDKVCNLHAAEVSGVVLPQNKVGDLLHATLKTAYLDMCGVPDGEHRQLSKPMEITQDMLSNYLADSSRIKSALDTAYQEMKDDDLSNRSSEHEAENYAILRMSRNVLEMDRKTAPFTLVWLEHRVNATIGGFTLSGIIDRMDIVTMDGERFVRVLDYKTGSYDIKKVSFSLDNLFTDPDKHYALQTLIYCELCILHSSFHHSINSSFTNHKSPITNSSPFRGLGGFPPLRPQLLFTRRLSEKGYLRCSALQDSDVHDYEAEIRSDFVAAFEAKLLHRISDNLRPGQEFVMQQDESICAKSYCPFHLLCNRTKQEY